MGRRSLRSLNYTSGGAPADALAAAGALTSLFQYSNAIMGYDYYLSNLPQGPRNQMVNANLHAKYPVLLGICYDTGSGIINTHTVICDGYGYDSSLMYHHLNFGWSGSWDGWYNLPNIGAGYNLNSVWKCVYNVYTSGTGEIIAGRVTNDSKTPLPIAGARVTASRTGGGTYSATTDANGIYALVKVRSASTYTINVTKSGYTFTPQSVSTGTSTNMSTNTGNQWGIDFEGHGVPIITLNQALDNNRLSFTTGGSDSWFGQDTTWYYGGSAALSGAILDGQTSWLQTTVQGPGTMTFYWKISTGSGDWFRWYLDSVGLWQAGGTSDDWYPATIKVPAGTHTIRWAYEKDASGSAGFDAVWVDKVVFTKTGVAPIYELLLSQ
ncbi:MAG: C10 family peptidase [Pseudomonadota bacterium]